MAAQQNKIDLLTVAYALRAAGELDKIGGPMYISELTSSVVSTANVLNWAFLLKELAMRRALNALCLNVLEQSFDGGMDVFELAENLKNQVVSVLEGANVATANYQTLNELYEDYLPKLLKRRESNIPRGIPCNISLIDDFLMGFEPGRMYVLAARPGVGKSALALQIALNVAAQQPVAFFNFEMTSEETTERALAYLSEIDARRMKLGRIDDGDYQQLMRAIDESYQRAFYLFDVANATVEVLRRSILTLNRKKQLGMVVIDYLQLLRSGRTRVNRYEEITEISGALKRLAKEADVPILLLCQMNREIEKRSSGLPLNSDLRDSGSIEQDADVIMFLTQDPDEYAGMPNQSTTDETRALRFTIAKNRNGASGFNMKIQFNTNKYKFFKGEEYANNEAIPF